MNENLVNEHFKQKGDDFIALVNFISLKGLHRNNVITLGLIEEIKELLSFKRNENKKLQEFFNLHENVKFD